MSNRQTLHCNNSSYGPPTFLKVDRSCSLVNVMKTEPAHPERSMIPASEGAMILDSPRWNLQWRPVVQVHSVIPRFTVPATNFSYRLCQPWVSWLTTIWAQPRTCLCWRLWISRIRTWFLLPLLETQCKGQITSPVSEIEDLGLSSWVSKFRYKLAVYLERSSTAVVKEGSPKVDLYAK